MLLSIITHHRNEHYLGDSLWRMQTCFNKLAHGLTTLGTTDVEIVCCDWGSHIPLKDVLMLSSDLANRLHWVVVDGRTARQADADSEYSAVHATNVAVRHCSGDYLLYLDIDVYVPEQTMRILLDCLRAGYLDGYNLRNAFFWGSRYHVPKEFVDSRPSQPELDAYISQYVSTFKYDIVNKYDFAGAATALLVTREMWYAMHGADERLRYWGWSDIDIHRRLCMRYAFGGDLEAYGMRFYHLEHYATRNLSVENPRRVNEMINPTQFEVNDENWGLNGCSVQIISH